jgi:hypothetical protein
MRTCEKSSFSIVLRTLLLFLVLVSPKVCWADITSTLSFQTMNEDMWTGSGTSAVNYTIFDPTVPISVNDTFGGITSTEVCFFGACYSTGSYGVQINAALNGSLNPSLNLELTGGDVNATVPVNVTLGFPTTVANNQPFDITSSGMFLPGASLTTDSPGVLLKMDVSANLSGQLTGEACAVACAGPFGPVFSTNGNKTFNLFTTNLLGIPLATSFHISPYFVAELDAAPYVGTSATTSQQQNISDSSTSRLTLSSSAVADHPFVSLNADITNAIAAGLGFEFPLDGSIQLGTSTLTYDIFRFLAGVGLFSSQSFTLSAQPEVAYKIVTVGPTPETTISDPKPLGVAQTFTIPSGATGAYVTPMYSMNALLTNTTGVVPGINLEFQALGLKYGSIGIQHLLDLGFPIPFDNATANFFDKTFSLGGWNTFVGDTFQITATTPEPSTILLLGAGLLLLAGFSRRTYPKALGCHT